MQREKCSICECVGFEANQLENDTCIDCLEKLPLLKALGVDLSDESYMYWIYISEVAANNFVVLRLKNNFKFSTMLRRAGRAWRRKYGAVKLPFGDIYGPLTLNNDYLRQLAFN